MVVEVVPEVGARSSDSLPFTLPHAPHHIQLIELSSIGTNLHEETDPQAPLRTRALGTYMAKRLPN